MVWIHGGSFKNGATSIYGPKRFAAQGKVVVVQAQYRLGAFGFLASPLLGSGSGNFGLEDQQAAMRWVQQNAASFGGNPRNVTIMGESAGGYSVCDHLASPTAAGLFQRAIIQSGPNGRSEPSRHGAERLAVLAADPTAGSGGPVTDSEWSHPDRLPHRSPDRLLELKD